MGRLAVENGLRGGARRTKYDIQYFAANTVMLGRLSLENQGFPTFVSRPDLMAKHF